MTRHVSYKGVTIDMDTMRRENEKVPAAGNMKVNAKGDQISGGRVTKTAEQMARENHRVAQAIVHTGLKGPMPSVPKVEQPKQKTKSVTPVKVKETELPSGDIIIEETPDKQ